MRLFIEGEINRSYCQNLCLIFFPGAKFPKKEDFNENVPEVYIKTYEKCGFAISEAKVIHNGKTADGYGSRQLDSSVSRERAFKISVGKAMLQAGTEILGSMPPWGILTGVRPAKISGEMSRRGLSKDEIISELMNDFCVSADKAKLLSEVNETEKYALTLAGKDTCSLYISIPFCPTRCAYCSFVSYSTPAYLSTIPDYLDILCRDIEEKCRIIKENGDKILTVYIGGGTPTVLNEKQLDRLLGTVNHCLENTQLLEFTVEAGRPDTVTEEKFKIMLEHGVDRTSINPQILDDGVLKKIGRRHSAKDFFKAYEIAVKSGIKSINTDLIAGLPSSNYEIFSKTVDKISELSPSNVTVHTYCVKKSAEFTERENVKGEDLGIYSYFGGDTSRCVDYSQKIFGESGYKPYYIYRQKNAQGNLENVGFSKPGYEGLYNIFIMEELQNIYAVGAGAVSKFIGEKNEKITRIFEPKYSYEYLRRHL